MTKKLMMIAAVAEAGFFRCGRHFPKAGVIVDADDFTEAELERLTSEKMLHVRAASDEEAGADDERQEQIADAVATLDAEDFQRDGKPKLDSLNALLADELGKISGAERDRVWDAMKDAGFEAPKASD